MALAQTKHLCKVCYQAKTRAYFRERRAKETPAEHLARKANLAAYMRNRPVEFKRCEDAYKKVGHRAPNHIPRWVTMESLLPVYAKAAQMDEDEPEYWHIVSHLIPLRMDRKVCGLHVINNLVIKRSKKLSGQGPSHLVPRSQYCHQTDLDDPTLRRNR